MRRALPAARWRSSAFMLLLFAFTAVILGSAVRGSLKLVGGMVAVARWLIDLV